MGQGCRMAFSPWSSGQEGERLDWPSKVGESRGSGSNPAVRVPTS